MILKGTKEEISKELNYIAKGLEDIAYDIFHENYIPNKWESLAEKMASVTTSLLIDGGKFMKNEFGYIGVVNDITCKWDFFEDFPNCKNVYSLTEDGYNVFYSWNNEGGYEDYDDLAMFELLARNEDFSVKVK